MQLNHVILENFRNYSAEEFVFDPKVNLVCGENAQGKTNLLEACALLSTMKLFRTGQKKEGLAFGQENGRVFGEFQAEGQPFTLEVRLHASKAMEFSAPEHGCGGRAKARASSKPSCSAPTTSISSAPGPLPAGNSSIPPCASCAPIMGATSTNTTAC